jgi:hypothetical protein
MRLIFIGTNIFNKLRYIQILFFGTLMPPVGWKIQDNYPVLNIIELERNLKKM